MGAVGAVAASPLGVFLLVVISMSFHVGQSQDVPSPVVVTTSGPIQGITTTVEIPPNPSQKVNIFRGIPFAMPPMGDLRFRAPVTPPTPWTTVRNATQYGPSCIQNLKSQNVPGIASEDCLYLNVYAPQTTPSSSLAVMVWIYGGSYRDGSATLYDGRLISALGNVIVVTMNYRLGAFGFLASTTYDFLPGNFGLLDQQAAIKWVNANIFRFGGNPNEVTIFGESAGAGSVNMHLISPTIKGYFRRAIAESGSVLSSFAVKRASEQTLSAQFLASELKCLAQTYVDVKCLRNASATQILTAQNLVYGFYADQQLELPFTPVFGGKNNPALPTDPLTALKTQDFRHVELMSGVNADEFSLFFVSKITATPTGSPSINMSVFSQQVNGFVGNGYSGFPPAGSNNYVKDTVRYAYTNWSDPHSGEQLLQGVIQCGTDFAFVCPLQLQADYWSSTENALQGAKLYQYLFSHRFGVYPEWAGVPHAAEVSFVFGLPLFLASYPKVPPHLGAPQENYTFTTADRIVSLTMINLWTSFAKTGDPSDGLPDNANFSTWPAYDSATRPYLDINAQVRVGNFLHNEKCQLLNHLSQTLNDNCQGQLSTPPPATTNPQSNTCPPAPVCSSTNRGYMYAVIVLSVVVALCFAEIVYMAFRNHSRMRTHDVINDADMHEGLLKGTH